jgi:hypothetical protein
MCPAIDNPSSCEMRALICSLQPENTSVAEIRRELCAAVYGHSIMGEGTEKQWSIMLKDGQERKCSR